MEPEYSAVQELSARVDALEKLVGLQARNLGRLMDDLKARVDADWEYETQLETRLFDLERAVRRGGAR